MWVAVAVALALAVVVVAAGVVGQERPGRPLLRPLQVLALAQAAPRQGGWALLLFLLLTRHQSLASHATGAAKTLLVAGGTNP